MKSTKRKIMTLSGMLIAVALLFSIFTVSSKAASKMPEASNGVVKLTEDVTLTAGYVVPAGTLSRQRPRPRDDGCLGKPYARRRTRTHHDLDADRRMRAVFLSEARLCRDRGVRLSGGRTGTDTL